jgi:hypothetical protein
MKRFARVVIARMSTMIRVLLGTILSGLLITSAIAQSYIWNPNSPRARREVEVYPPPKAPPTAIAGTVVPDRWGTLSKPWPERTWGTYGGAGWVGVGTQTSPAPF